MSFRSLNIAGTGMYAMQQLVDVIADNIANSNTTGFKTGKVSFNDLIYQTDIRPGTQNNENGEILPAGIDFGLGVSLGSIYKNHNQGTLTPTPGAPLNIAINGNGYMLVTLPNGDTAYTRDGNIQRSPDGELVNLQGHVISPGITIPIDALNITISPDGQVQVTIQGTTTPVLLGQLDLAIFNNPAGLKALGNNLYLETASSGTPTQGKALDDGFGEIRQFFLEDSNVNTITEVTNLIKAQRNYEMNSKVIHTTDQMYKNITDAKA